ncbi:MAG TPA: AIR synthase-related protein, partial [Gemmatimonadaceae bacterium]|nr:AIR synthase-related protein [Gemmatimonadaceae bacterium]
LLLGDMGTELGGSEYLATIHNQVFGAPPKCDLERERAVIDALLESIHAGVVSSAHDCSDGGLAVALAECCIADRTEMSGAEIDLSSWDSIPDRGILFGETQGRILISSSSPETVLEIATKFAVPAGRIGTVRRDSDTLAIKLPDRAVSVKLSRLQRAYHDSIPSVMSRTPEHATFDELAPVAGH